MSRLWLVLASVVALAVWTVEASLYRAIHPGGDTGCARGGAYSFYVKEGTVNKLVVELQGGGCCFNKETCALPIYTFGVSNLLEEADLNGIRGGIGSNTDDRNPVKDWTRVYVPYCTGDGHIGNASAPYGVDHKGMVNFMSAMEWIQTHYKNKADPDAVLVTGHSAGSVGSYVLAPYVFDEFPNARQLHMGDSYLPLFGKTGYDDGFKNWGALDAYDDSIGLTPQEIYPWTRLISAGIMIKTARRYPNAIFSSITSNSDSTQSGFYVVQGGGFKWKQDARLALQELSSASNFHSFVAPGSGHVLTNDDGMYGIVSTIQTGPTAGTNITLGEWVTLLTSVEPPNLDLLPARVDCAPNC